MVVPVSPGIQTSSSKSTLTKSSVLLIVVAFLAALAVCVIGLSYFLPQPSATETSVQNLSADQKQALLEQSNVAGESVEAKTEVLQDAGTSDTNISAEQKANLLSSPQ